MQSPYQKRSLMKTIILNQPEQFELTQTAEPDALAPGEALVRVQRIGVCGTDLHAFRGRQPFFSYPRILGHELGVEVVEVGPNDAGIQAGDRCSVEPYLNCGQCIACRRGRTNCCTALKVLGVSTDGGMREYIKLPIHKLHKSDKLTVDQLALVETLCIGAHAVSRAQPERDEVTLVIGAGPIGLTVIEGLKPLTSNIIVMDVNEGRLDFCRRELEVPYTINALKNPTEQLRQLTNGDMPTLIFEATGNVASMHQSFSYAAHGSKLVLVGLVQGEITFNDPEFHRHEMTLLSSRNAVAADFKHVIGQMESGSIDTTPWITHRAPFESVIDTFPTWLDPATGVIKALIEV